MIALLVLGAIGMAFGLFAGWIAAEFACPGIGQCGNQTGSFWDWWGRAIAWWLLGFGWLAGNKFAARRISRRTGREDGKRRF